MKHWGIMEQEKAKLEFLKSLNKVQGLIEPVTKDKTNPHFKSGYASLAAVNETIMGLLAENGFIILSGGAEIGGKPWLRTTLLHVGGHSMSFDYPLLVTDANPQHLASATTYARRYSLCALFNLSTEDDDGNDAVKTVTREPAQARTPTPAARAAAQSTTAAPGVETVTGVVSVVIEKEGLGKAAGKTVWEITIDGKKMSTFDEAQGNLAIESRDTDRSVNVGYKVKGQYLNLFYIKWEHPSADKAESQEIEEVPF